MNILTASNGGAEKKPTVSIINGVGHLSATLTYESSGISPADRQRANTALESSAKARPPVVNAKPARNRNGIAS